MGCFNITHHYNSISSLDLDSDWHHLVSYVKITDQKNAHSSTLWIVVQLRIYIEIPFARRHDTALRGNLVKAAEATWQKLGEGFAKKLIYQTMHALMSYGNKKCIQGKIEMNKMSVGQTLCKNKQVYFFDSTFI